MSSYVDALYDLAEVNSGYFTAAEAKQNGVSQQLLRHHTLNESIVQVAHGIYRFTRFPTQPFEDLIIATLWAGPGSAISHESALTVHGVGDAMPSRIHITLPRQFRGVREGVVVHHASLPTRDCTRRHNVATTTIERTLVDVALRSDKSLVRTALDDAMRQGLTTTQRLGKRIRKSENAEAIADILGISL